MPFGDFASLTAGGFNPLAITWFLFLKGGWIVLVVLLFVGLGVFFVRNRRLAYDRSIKWTLLAIDIPKNNEQTPKAVENIFSHLLTLEKKGDLYERLWKGYNQQPLCFEVVSLGGYVQFLVRLPTEYRDLIEAAFYAQYPDAEITEVEDYVDDVPHRFPDREWDMWGTELKLENKEYYPILTYPMFEHPLTQTFLDPFASLLEILSRLRRGEQAWIQISVIPAEDSEWRASGIHAIKRLIGEKGGGGGGILGAGQDFASGTWQTLVASIYPPEAGGQSEKGPPNLMQYLPPHDRRIVEAIGIKISKPAWKTKIRVVYMAKKKLFQSDRPASIVGAMLQYNTLDLNGFKTDKMTKTAAKYYRAEQRKTVKKNKLIRAYRELNLETGPRMYALNVEELASIFHFPVMTVKAPLVKKTEAKKAEPPVALPTVEEAGTTDQEESISMPPTLEQQAQQAAAKPREEPGPPPNLPVTG